MTQNAKMQEMQMSVFLKNRQKSDMEILVLRNEFLISISSNLTRIINLNII